MATTNTMHWRRCGACHENDVTVQWRDGKGLRCAACNLTPESSEPTVVVEISDALRFRGVAEPVRVVRAPRTWTF